MRLRYTRQAIADIDRILGEIAVRSPRGADTVSRRILAVISVLLLHPGLGRMTSRRGMRRAVAAPFRYLIFYRSDDEEIVIHAVRHGARKPSTMPDR